MKAVVKYQQGYIDVAFVFSCPGRIEEKCNHVCAGATGDNLQILVDYLHQHIPDKFPSSSKDDYYITNASDKVHYMDLTGDTEASIEEIMEPQNLQRLKKELDNCKVVICMGNKAFEAISKTNLHTKILDVGHLSNRNLNSHFSSKKTVSAERKKDRIQQIGDLIINKINKEGLEE